MRTTKVIDGEVYVETDESKAEKTCMSTSYRRVRGRLVDEDGFEQPDL